MTVGLWVLLGLVAVSACAYFLIQNISSQLGTDPLVMPATSMDHGYKGSGAPMMSFQKHGYPKHAADFASQSKSVTRDALATPATSMDHGYKSNGAPMMSFQKHEYPKRAADFAPQSIAVTREPLFLPGRNLALKGTSKERLKRILVNGQEVYKGPESDDVTLKISAKPGQQVAVVEEFEDVFEPTSTKPKRGVTPQPASDEVPLRGLVLMADPLEKILTGRKTMELRSRQNRQLGKIALIRKGSGHIYGVADIIESVGPMDIDEFRARMDEHGVESSRLQEVFDKGWTIGWRMANVKKLRNPVPYVHKGMSQVKLDDEAIAGLRAALASAIQI